jgi:hypothetical protein
MKIVFSGLTLGDDENGLPISARTVNGVAVFEAVDIVQAARKRFFFRGNEAVTLSFSVVRVFDSIKEAEVFWLTQWSLIQKAGLCQITCGNGDDTQDVYMANAVCAGMPQGGCLGVRVVTQYQISAPDATTDVPPSVLTDAVPMILRGSANLTVADESKAIVFDAPFTPCPSSQPASASRTAATISSPTCAMISRR